MSYRLKLKKNRPGQIRIDGSTACQLKCRSCPTAQGETGKNLGVGFLPFADFKTLVDKNQWVSAVELANWGEIFLNPDLEEIVRYAHDRGIALSASTGVNLNQVEPSLLETLVRYRFRSLTCSIDGASQDIYARYRVHGDLRRVIGNLKSLYRLKAYYKSPYPRLKWQFILFDHNAQEIEAAQNMAHQLGMSFALKLSWSDLYTEDFSSISEAVQQRAGLKIASRRQFNDVSDTHYFRENQCAKMWTSPQINYDGRVLGCPVNYWADYGNCLTEGLTTVLSGEKICYARQMLLGNKESRRDIACSSCQIYHQMEETGKWLSEKDLRSWQPRGRAFVRLENQLLNHRWTAAALCLWLDIKQSIGPKNMMTYNEPSYSRKILDEFRRQKMGRIKSRAAPLQMQKEAKAPGGAGWTPYPQFKGRTRCLRHLSCHVSFLEQGCCPHPPHRHKEEEILLVLAGEVELTLPDVSAPGEMSSILLGAGDFVFYPGLFGHTITCVGTISAQYLMFKWHDREEPTDNELTYGRFSVNHSPGSNSSQKGFHFHKMFEGATRCLERLQCHLSTLPPHTGYPPHRDPYNVAIIVLEGEVETIGQRVGPHGLVYYPAGTAHGMSNPGNVAATYLVFEFQGRPKHLLDKVFINWLRLMRKIREPKCWQGLLSHLTLKKW